MDILNQKELEEILICPITQEKLSFLSDFKMDLLHQRFDAGDLSYPDKFYKEVKWDAALQAGKHDIFYLIIDDIIHLLPELALRHKGSEISKEEQNEAKHQVKAFYDLFGWQQKQGIYQDAQDSEDLREVSKTYIAECHLRLKQHLPSSGKYLLDVACGPIQYPIYMTYSENFDYRICADMSLTALQEAKKKLHHKGRYLLCDVTRLPLAARSVDAVISLHTLYHVPKEEQAKAFSELDRVLMPGGTSVIVYSWGRNALLMNMLMFPFKLFSLLKKIAQKALVSQKKAKSLYFYAHNYAWFCREIQPKYHTLLFSWRSVSVPFLRVFIHSKLGGKSLLKGFFWLESKFPKIMGKIGAYPLFVSKKACDEESV